MSDYLTKLQKERQKREEEFFKTFPTLHCKRPEPDDEDLWVFWSQEHHEIQQQQQQGFQINNNNDDDSFSADVDTRRRTTISDKIKDAFSMVKRECYDEPMIVIQFWALVTTIGGRRLLSTSGQPFAVSYLLEDLSKYRLRCVECHNDDVNNNNKQPTATAFLNRLPKAVSFQSLKGVSPTPLVDSALECGFSACYMLPVCCPSQSTSCCIGVVEFSTHSMFGKHNIISIIRALEEVGLGVFQVQERIPSQIISGLKPAKAEIEDVLKIVCKSHDIALAQVWIRFEDDNHVSFSSYLEGTQNKQMLSLKLTGYLPATDFRPCLDEYYGLCDMFPLEMGEDFVEKTLEDYKPRFCNDVSKLSGDTLVKELFDDDGVSRLAICLNSIHTGAFCYAFEFIWEDDRDSVVKFVEELLLKLKELLPSFKLASGAELGDELDFIKVGDSTATETKFLKIFQGKRLSPIPEVSEEGRRIPVPMVADCIAPLEAKYKTTPIPLSREVIEQQFGNTETEAAENLKEPGDELDVPDVENSTSEKILQENILLPVPEALGRGKKPMVGNYIAPSARKYKTAPILLSQEAIEHQYGNTMKEAANTLNVSISTLKRKCKAFGISEWQGPNLVKRKVNDSSNQSYTNEEYDGAVQDPSAINKNENTLTKKSRVCR